jgi:hypothetical protein
VKEIRLFPSEQSIKEELMQHPLSYYVDKLKNEGVTIPITIQSVILKKNKPDLRYLEAVVIQDEEEQDGSILFRLLKTSSTFQSWHFPLEEGCVIGIEDTDKRYVVTKVKYDMYPKLPLVKATRLR